MITTSNALMTGGTGFVGSWMVKKRPPDINVGIMNSDTYNKWPILEDIENMQYIIHLAPVPPTRAIACAKRLGARLLYASSGIVYHPENDTEYRRAKLDGERECLDSGVDVVIARLFTFMDSSRVWKAMFNAARNGGPLFVHIDSQYGDAVRSFMHGSEMARWMWAILLRGESGDVYDVGSDNVYSITQFAERIQAFTGCEFAYISECIPVPVYLPEDMAKTRALL